MAYPSKVSIMNQIMSPCKLVNVMVNFSVKLDRWNSKL